MNTSLIITQVIPAATDSAHAARIQTVTNTVNEHVGSITKTITNPDSLANLTPSKLASGVMNFNWGEVITSLSTQIISLALRIIAAILIFYIGKFIINKIYALVRTMLIKKDVDRSLGTFLLSFLKFSLLFFLFIIVIGVIGIETSSFIAIFASAGLAIGMALSGTLQNFAGGMLILLIKPYKIGDYIEFGEFKGHVKEIQLFHTVLISYNNDRLIIPNGGLSTGSIKNLTAEKNRRLEWRISISYGDNIDTARKVILNLLGQDSRILKPETIDEDDITPNESDNASNENSNEPNKESFWKRTKNFFRHKINDSDWHTINDSISISNLPKKDFTPCVWIEDLSESAVILIVRAWCKVPDYWNVLYSINENIYKELPQHGLHFPFPQMDVHVMN